VVLATDRRRWLIQASVGALVLVILQGVLGGARVLLDERLVALIHGCVVPLFFAFLAGLIAVTSPRQISAASESSGSGRLARAACVTVALAYAQLVLGAIVRHTPLTAPTGLFSAALVLHLLLAFALTAHVVGMAW